MSSHSTARAGPALLSLRWIALILEVPALVGYLFINAQWGIKSWILVAYVTLIPSIFLDISEITLFGQVPRPLLAIVELLLIVLAVIACFLLASTFGIGWPEHPPWLGLGYFLVYDLMGLIILRFIFFALGLVYLYRLAMYGLHENAPREEDQQVGEREPLIRT